MFLRRPAFVAILPAVLLACGPARGDVGATLSLQTDARDRGMSYSGNRPSAQLGLAGDFDAGWYGGLSLGEARFAEHRGPWLRAYGGRVMGLVPGLNGEFGLLAHRFDRIRRYDFVEAYAGLLGERWSLRVYASPDYYGIGQRSVYAEVNGRWPLCAEASSPALVGHAGVLRGWGGGAALAYTEPSRPTRTDLRAGLSWPWGVSGEWQLLWTSASRGGPFTWTDASRRRAVSLNFTLGF